MSFSCRIDTLVCNVLDGVGCKEITVILSFPTNLCHYSAPSRVILQGLCTTRGWGGFSAPTFGQFDFIPLIFFRNLPIPQVKTLTKTWHYQKYFCISAHLRDSNFASFLGKHASGPPSLWQFTCSRSAPHFRMCSTAPVPAPNCQVCHGPVKY